MKLTVKKIPLNQYDFTIVDNYDYDYLMQWDWCYHNGYATRGYPTVGMHRIILQRMGFRSFAKSDHINRNKLDNRRCNLRPATDSQNSCNQGIQKNNTSGYKGVHWSYGKWRAVIGVNGKKIYLGSYNDPKEAARAYNKAALKYHGEFAVLNEV